MRDGCRPRSLLSHLLCAGASAGQIRWIFSGVIKHRRQRRDGRRHQHHAGADRAVIVSSGILIRGGLVRRSRRSVGGNLRMARAGGGQAEILRMNMAEGKNRLQRQRKQREADISPDMSTSPAHRHRTNSPRTNKRDFVYGRTVGLTNVDYLHHASRPAAMAAERRGNLRDAAGSERSRSLAPYLQPRLSPVSNQILIHFA
jgi:hypothetical protein